MTDAGWRLLSIVRDHTVSAERKQATGEAGKTSSNSATSKITEKTSATSSEMKKAAGNTGTHDGGLLEAQSVGRSIFAVMVLVIITGSAIFLTFRKKAVKKNRRTRK